MKSLQAMLVSELWSKLSRIRATKSGSDYYNEMLGDTSYLLAALLEQLLKNSFYDWDPKKWIDDSLLTKIKLEENKLSIWGIMIWGIVNETEQWTEPFYFEIELSPITLSFTKLTFLFSDLDNSEITYESFSQKRNYWDKKYYTNDKWNPSERNWKYIINTKNV